MVFTSSRKALTQVPCSAGPCTQLPVCIASLLLLMPSLLHGEDPGWEKANVLSLVLQVTRPRIAGSPTPSTWMSYCLGWACPDRNALNQSSIRPEISTNWEVERRMGLPRCHLGRAGWGKGQKGE